ncbi:MAG TPA: hypothetical protein VGW12_14590 [Pyrinomonadaceae bacterium]|nr:hypothetical protein [Pyrinomonadaceae bacterium]
MSCRCRRRGGQSHRSRWKKQAALSVASELNTKAGRLLDRAR